MSANLEQCHRCKFLASLALLHMHWDACKQWLGLGEPFCYNVRVLWFTSRALSVPRSFVFLRTVVLKPL